MSEAITAFDAVAVVLILLSALMAFARGFMRELATLGAFIGAMAGAFVAQRYLGDPVAAFFGEGTPEWLPTLFVVVVVFIVVYAIIAWFGARLSRNIQGLDGIGMMDRVAGGIFGAARGAIAVVFFVLLLNVARDSEDIPDWIQDGGTYPTFRAISAYVQTNAPLIADDVKTAIPVEELTERE